MPVPTGALVCALGAGLLAALTVAQSRVGLGLALTLAAVLAAGVAAAPRRPSWALAALSVALAAQAVWRDAGWVVAADVVAALLAGAAAVGAGRRWQDVARDLAAPWRLLAGGTLVGRAVAVAARPLGGRRLAPAARGLTLAGALTALFGGLFASADRAFARTLEEAVSVDADLAGWLWRALLGAVMAAAAGAMVRAGRPAALGPQRPPRGGPGRTEVVIALTALLTLFAAFVAVQLRVLLEGASYVQTATGLGYGEYARQGFTQLLVTAVLTLGVVAATAARHRDRLVRGLLAGLCVLTLAVMVAALNRLDLVQDAYGLTRVRYAGYALVAWIGAALVLTLLAGADRRLARRLPRLMTGVTLGGVLLFSLSNPDARIAERAVQRAAAGHAVDTTFLRQLSADALPALERLPSWERSAVVPVLRGRLGRPDGVTGLNLARRRAR